MTVPSTAAVREPGSPLIAAPPDPQVDSSFDARWDAWIEKGNQHDRAANLRLRIVLFSAAAIGVLVMLFNLASRAR